MARLDVRLANTQPWGVQPARPFPSSIFPDKNRRDIGKSQSTWTDSKMETGGSRVCDDGLASAASEGAPSKGHTLVEVR
jgi:hypothetical protein